MKQFISALLCLFMSFTGLNAQTKKLLFIGIDGCRHDAISTGNCPTLDELIWTGIYSTDCLTLYPTWSGNGWSTMTTGVRHDKHNVTDNNFTAPNYDEYPDFIARLEEFDPTLNTYSVVHWAPINDIIQQDTDNEINVATDLEVKNQAIEILTNSDPDVLFLDFDDVDHAGHTYGFHPSVAEYMNAIEITDLYIEQVLNALEARPTYADEDWLIMVTTDHGGNLAGHGLGSFEERNSFIACYNQDFVATEIAATDITAQQTVNIAHFDPGTYATPENQAAFEFGNTQDFTIEFWVKTATGFTDDPTFISNKDWNSGLNAGFVISAQSGQFWKVNIGDGNDRADIQGGYINDEWTHLAVSFDRNGWMKAYEDGALVGMVNISAIDNINSGLPLIINQDGTTTYANEFDGYYRDIRVWNEVIDQDVLVQWATIPIDNSHPNYSSLIAEWRCGTENGTTLDDSGPASNDCTLSAELDWASQSQTFTITDYSASPKEQDNAVTALTWFCVPIEEEWNLDGRSLLESCGSLVQNTSTTSISIYPNPSDGLFRITSGSPVEKVEVYSATGALCAIVNRSSLVDLRGFDNGLYILKVYSGGEITRFHSLVNK